MKLPGEAEPVGGVPRLKLRVQLVRGLEKRNAEAAPVTLEPVPQGGEGPIGVHPLAKIGKDLFAGLLSVQSFQLGPILRLRLPDETEHGLGEDGALAVESICR